MKNYFGIDVGGTFIKGAIIMENGEIIAKDKIPTESDKGGEKIVENVAALCKKLLSTANMTLSDIESLGMGVPGMIDTEGGVVVKSGNLGLRNFEIRKKTEEALGLTVRISNDANLAALGEMKYGFGGRYKNVFFVTLGTGVGSGIIIDGKLYEGNRGAGAEFGHVVMKIGGEPCKCGRRGCLEAYASATALIRETKKAMQLHPDSKLWELGSLDAVDGKSAFDYKDTDVYAKEVVDAYVEMLSAALTNVANLLRPEAIIIGGGISAQGESLINPIKERISKEIFAGGENSPAVEILPAKLGNDAGCLGAAALAIAE